MKISVVVPAYNECESLPELCRRIVKTMETNYPTASFEIILVNDGSTDGTLKVLQRIFETHPGKIRSVTFRTRQGKALALLAGFQESTGNYVITMDADLQDDPSEIPEFIDKLEENFDMVNGRRNNRQDTYIRRRGSSVFNSVVRLVSGLQILDFNSGFKAYSAQLVKRICIYGQYHRYIPLQAHFLGYRVVEIPISNSPRQFGESKFKTWRYEGLFDLISMLFIYKYSHSPLHFFWKDQCNHRPSGASHHVLHVFTTFFRYYY